MQGDSGSVSPSKQVWKGMRGVTLGGVPQSPCKTLTSALAAGFALFTNIPQFMVTCVVSVAYSLASSLPASCRGLPSCPWQPLPKQVSLMMPLTVAKDASTAVPPAEPAVAAPALPAVLTLPALPPAPPLTLAPLEPAEPALPPAPAPPGLAPAVSLGVPLSELQPATLERMARTAGATKNGDRSFMVSTKAMKFREL